MDDVILATRDLIGDLLITTGRDVFIYESIISSKIFTLTESNISSTTILVYKNGILWSVTGSSENWTRVGTVITITKTAHGLVTGDVITITASSVPAGLPLGTYTITTLTANTFTIVGINTGTANGTCTWSNYVYSTTTGKITIGGTLVVGDSLEVDYSYYEKYSDTELSGHIRGAISYLAIEKYKCFLVKPPSLIFPTPTQSEIYLIAVIASILIKDDIVQYRTPELTMIFERGDSKEVKIKKFIRQFKKTMGVLDYIDLSETTVLEDEDEE
jgi:hypothetical protein